MYKTRRDMSMVFKFRMLSDENDHFVRDYEVPYDMTLLGFHEFITRSLGYEEGMSSFFTADKQWNRLREFTLMDMGDNSEDAPLPMADITLGQLIHNNRDRLIYQSTSWATGRTTSTDRSQKAGARDGISARSFRARPGSRSVRSRRQ